LAFVAVGDYAAAEAEYRHLMALRDSISADRMVGHSRAHDLLNLAGAVLAGQRLAANGQFDDATGKLQKAVQLEDGLGYDEPPDWYYPVRETLGAVLVTAGRPAEAERVFRDDLRRTPHNPWSLHGLARTLHDQQKTSEANEVEEAFRRAWANADLIFFMNRFEASLGQSERPLAGGTGFGTRNQLGEINFVQDVDPDSLHK
jgi:predicted Zn-dependent protease